MRNSRVTVAASRRLPICAIAVALGLLLSAFAATAAQGTDAVEAHKGKLDPSVVVWCIDNPRLFKVAASAYGIDVGTSQKDEVIAHHGRTITLLDWAQLMDKRSRQEFETVCETAFTAFSRSALDVALDGIRRGVIGPQVLHDITKAGEHTGLFGVSTDSEVGVVGLLIGILGTAGLGALSTHNQGNRDEAGELNELAKAFTDSLEVYLEDQSNQPAIGRASAAGARLRNGITAWRPQNNDAAQNAITVLDTLVGSSPPSIGDPGELDDVAFRTKLLSKAGDVQANVARLAEDVAKRRRLSGPSTGILEP